MPEIQPNYFMSFKLFMLTPLDHSKIAISWKFYLSVQNSIRKADQTNLFDVAFQWLISVMILNIAEKLVMRKKRIKVDKNLLIEVD